MLSHKTQTCSEIIYKKYIKNRLDYYLMVCFNMNYRFLFLFSFKIMFLSVLIKLMFNFQEIGRCRYKRPVSLYRLFSLYILL